MNAKKDDLPDHERFQARLEELAVTVASVGRRAGVTRNTVKAYMQGKPVRDVTEHKLWEAIAQIAAEKGVATELGVERSVVAIGKPSNESAIDLLKKAELTFARAHQLLNEAYTKASNEGTQIPENVVANISRWLRQSEVVLREPN